MRAGCVEVDPPGVRFSFVSHMAGLYFHIPFCRRICAYCDFFKSAEVGRVDSVLDAMGRELDGAVDWLADRRIRTVYFGGGTPSLCDPARLQGLADRAATLLDCSGVEEFTVEANPDDMTEEWLEALARTGANRLSVGVQSFDDDELRLMNRRHTGAQAVEAVRRAQAAGFANLTIDLIFGVPGFGGKVLQRNLEQALALGVQHISAYHLTVEKNTAFGRRLERGRFSEVDEQVSEREYLEVHRTLTGAGFEHYEVSNYALPGCRARHNAAYWSGDEYLGIGPAAHSFNGKSRRWGRCVDRRLPGRCRNGGDLRTGAAYGAGSLQRVSDDPPAHGRGTRAGCGRNSFRKRAGGAAAAAGGAFHGDRRAVFRGRPTGDSGGEVPGVGCRDRRVVRSGRLIVE